MGGAVEDRVRAQLACGRQDEASTLALEALGGGILGYLCAILDEDDGQDAFSLFAEDLWRGIRSWRGDGSLRAWAYRIAWNAARRISRDTYRRRRERLRSSAASRLAASIASASRGERGGRHDRLRILRAGLTPEEQSLLVLHVDRELEWEEIGTILGGERPVSAATLRKRSQRLKAKLRARARRRGLLK